MNADDRPPDDNGPRSGAARREAWSRYWARGALHSCPGYGERYGGSIARFWRDVFAGLPPGARVLDIATGNGVLPRMLLEQCRSPDLTCDAVDLATVQLPWLAQATAADHARVRLHGGIDAARLPFADGLFDLIVSQYGLEYTEMDAAVSEMLRVLAPGGAVAMMLHHAQGRPAALARIEIEHAHWLTEGGWFEAAEALVEPMARAATAEGRASLQGDRRANAVRERFNTMQDELSRRAASGDGADVLFEARDVAMRAFELAGHNGVPAGRALLASFRVELAAAVTRLRDLLDHALSEDQARALCERVANALSAPVLLDVLREREQYVMGWTIRGPHRPVVTA